MNKQSNDASQQMLHIATTVATDGFAIVPVGHGDCSVPGCCGGRLQHPWTYTIGLVELGQPELVVLGIDPHMAAHGIDWVVDEAEAGRPVPVDTPWYVGPVGLKLVDVPVEWLLTDPGRMASWFNHYGPETADLRAPDVRQLVWADEQGRFPDAPLCDPTLVAVQPLLSSDPRRYPMGYKPYRNPARHRRPARRR